MGAAQKTSEAAALGNAMGSKKSKVDLGISFAFHWVLHSFSPLVCVSSVFQQEVDRALFQEKEKGRITETS